MANSKREGRTTQWIDIHCHCLHALDDGPENLTEAVALCRALVADGVGQVVATPHQLGRYEGMVRAAAIKQKVEELNAALREARVPLYVYPGADIRLDERLVELLRDGEILPLGGSRYVLIEIPHEVYVDPTPALRRLSVRGFEAIVSHPERHLWIQRRPSLVDTFLACGAHLQVTAGSLAGAFGEEAKRVALRWIKEDKVACVATDAHDTSERAPAFTAAALQIAGTVGAQRLLELFEGNPRRIVQNRDLSVGRSRYRAGGKL